MHIHAASRLLFSRALDRGSLKTRPSHPLHSTILSVLCEMLTRFEVSLLKGLGSTAEKLGGLAWACWE